MGELELILLFAIQISLCVMGIITRTSKKIYVIIFIFVWILLAFSMDSYDISNYRYTYSLGISRGKEAFFDDLSFLLYTHGVSFDCFKFLWGTVICLILYKGLQKYTSQTSAMIAIFAIMPLFGFVTQMRNSMAGAIVIYALPYLLENKFVSYIKYCLLICLSFMFHNMAAFYIVLILPAIIRFSTEKYKKIILLTVIALLFVFWFYADYIQMFFTWFALVCGDESIQSLTARGGSYFNAEYRSNTLGMAINVMHHYLMFILTDGFLKRIENINSQNSVKNMNISISIMRNINTTMLLVIPFYAISTHFSRFFYYYLPMCYGCVLENSVAYRRLSVRIGSSLFSYQELIMILFTIFIFVIGILHDPTDLLRLAGGIRLPW